jgi:hypothetical protein
MMSPTTDSQLGLSKPLLGETLSTVHLYLIRQGEAMHNIKEKAAKAAALQECMQEGLSKNDPETLQRIDQAQKSILKDVIYGMPVCLRMVEGKEKQQEKH